jgi:repressor LexA
MTDLTHRQQAILTFIQRELARDGRPPTILEIAAHFELASPNGVAKHLQALAEKGYLTLTGGARGIRLRGTARPADTVDLPLVGSVAAGEPIFQDAYIERAITVERGLFRPRPKYLLRVQGASMMDAGILDGDLIGVHPTRSAEHGQIVVARLGEEAITVKRLYRKGRSLRLLSCNPQFAPIDPDSSEDFAIEGLYCGLIRIV